MNRRVDSRYKTANFIIINTFSKQIEEYSGYGSIEEVFEEDEIPTTNQDCYLTFLYGKKSVIREKLYLKFFYRCNPHSVLGLLFQRPFLSSPGTVQC